MNIKSKIHDVRLSNMLMNVYYIVYIYTYYYYYK